MIDVEVPEAGLRQLLPCLLHELVAEVHEIRFILNFELEVEPRDEIVHVEQLSFLRADGDVAEDERCVAGGLDIGGLGAGGDQ